MRIFYFDWDKLRTFPPEIETSLSELTETVGKLVTHVRELSASAKKVDIDAYVQQKGETFRDVAANAKFYELNLWRDRLLERQDLEAIDPQRIEAGKRLLRACVEADGILGDATTMLDHFDDYLWDNKDLPGRAQIRQQGNHVRMSVNHLHNQTALLQARLVHQARQTTPSQPSLHHS